MKTNILTKEQFSDVLNLLEPNKKLDLDYFYDIYLNINETIIAVIKQNEGYNFVPLNPVTIILYILDEFNFLIKNVQVNKLEEFIHKEKFISILSSACADKYLTNEQLNFKSTSYLNRFNINVSTLSLYLNFILRTLEAMSFKDRFDALINDMLKKAFSMCKCILNLITEGYETEAFSTWRTLHENECILIVLLKNGENIFKSYLRHITYSLAYRNQINNKEEVDEIFKEIKEKMKLYDLKSKDIKKFIEYGYLFAIPNKQMNIDFKLNFRDGVEKMAGLSTYSKVYEMSSEISHSSPLLLYSSKEYYFITTMINLYETFIRLESIFSNYYELKAPKNFVDQYKLLQKTYLVQIIEIYRDNFAKLKNKVNKDFKSKAE